MKNMTQGLANDAHQNFAFGCAGRLLYHFNHCKYYNHCSSSGFARLHLHHCKIVIITIVLPLSVQGGFCTIVIIVNTITIVVPLVVHGCICTIVKIVIITIVLPLIVQGCICTIVIIVNIITIVLPLSVQGCICTIVVLFRLHREMHRALLLLPRNKEERTSHFMLHRVQVFHTELISYWTLVVPIIVQDCICTIVIIVNIITIVLPLSVQGCICTIVFTEPL